MNLPLCGGLRRDKESASLDTEGSRSTPVLWVHGLDPMGQLVARVPVNFEKAENAESIQELVKIRNPGF